MKSPRNLMIYGVSVMVGLAVPTWMKDNPGVINSGRCTKRDFPFLIDITKGSHLIASFRTLYLGKFSNAVRLYSSYTSQTTYMYNYFTYMYYKFPG